MREWTRRNGRRNVPIARHVDLEAGMWSAAPRGRTSKPESKSKGASRLEQRVGLSPQAWASPGDGQSGDTPMRTHAHPVPTPPRTGESVVFGQSHTAARIQVAASVQGRGPARERLVLRQSHGARRPSFRNRFARQQRPLVYSLCVVVAAGLALATVLYAQAGGTRGSGARASAANSMAVQNAGGDGVLPPPAATASRALRVLGTHLVDTAGRVVTLRGASRWSLEFDCHGDDHFQLSDFVAMKSWGMNAVRIPLNSSFWLYGYQNYCTAQSYQQVVDGAVHNAEAAGLRVILVLQWAGVDLNSGRGGQTQMPPRDALTFWVQITRKYSSHPTVMFSAFSEPHDVDWSTWSHGNEVFAGMQEMVNVINANAPGHVVFVSGLQWAYKLDGAVGSNAIDGSNVAYEEHIYQWWDPPNQFLAMTKIAPVIAGEFGINDCCHDYTATVMSFFEGIHTGYFGWAWTDVDDHSLLAPGGWQGTPTAMGAGIRTFLLRYASTP